MKGNKMMTPDRRKYLSIIILLVLGCVAVFRVQSQRGNIIEEDTFASFPLSFGQWQGEDLEISDRVYEVLETKNIIMRRYRDADGDSVFLAIVGGGENRAALHPPEYCYLGGGATLIAKSFELVGPKSYRFEANKLSMDMPDGLTQAWYWFTLGSDFMGDYYNQQLHFLFALLKGSQPQGALIRISVKGEGKTLENKAKLFIEDVTPVLKVFFSRS